MSIAAAPFSPSRIGRFGPDLRMPLIVAVAYYLGAEAAFLVGTLSDKIFAPFWPPNIVLLCALLLSPPSRWWVYLLAAFPAHVIAELGIGMPVPQLLVAFATNCMVAIGSAVAVRAWGETDWFGNLRNACLFLCITAIASPAVTALAGAFMPIMGGEGIEHYWRFWAQWFMANAITSLTLGPVALIWLTKRPQFLAIPGRTLLEAGFLFAALVSVCAVAFEIGLAQVTTSFLPALLYSPLPLVLWAELRFGVKGAASAILIVTIVLIWRALNGTNVFVAADPETSVLAIQAFLIGLTVPVLLLGASIDETRNAERAVRESEERMSFAAASANVCMWSYDRTTDRFWVTDHGRQMLGFRAHLPLTRHTILDAIHPEDRQAAVETMRATMTASTLADWEVRVVRPDGELRWLRCRARAHGDLEGRAAHVTGTFSDITEQREAELEIVRQRQELAHLMRVSLLGELAGGIAHELTQPLSAILSNAEAARIHAGRASITPDNPELEEVALILDDIIDEGNRAGEVIHRIRGMLKKSTARFELVDMNDLATSTLRLLHNELITRRVKTVLDFAQNLPPVAGDPIQLQQVLLNLAMNAMDAMSEVAQPERRVVISTQATAEGGVLVSVSDRGVGLKDDDRHQVFHPFFTTKERGLGLGLSLCSSIIKQHGGELGLANNPAGGATATFRLPCRDSAAVAD